MSYTHSTDPGPATLIVGAVFPAAVIVFELATGWCASTFFDPLPTWGHLLLVMAVPVINALLWRAARREDAGSKWLLTAGAASIAISASYTLLFLPILPFALVGVLLLGIGLLPFAPVGAMLFAWKWSRDIAGRHAHAVRRTAAGIAMGVTALALVDLPATATQVALDRYDGDASERRSAVALMRNVGDRSMLLRLSYGDSARVTGLAGFLISAWSKGPNWSEGTRTAEARELYFRVTGQAFNAAPRPEDRAGGIGMFSWDDDQGGEDVGGRVPALALAGSRIDGSVAARDNLAQLEWTFDIANTGEMEREARFTLALPEGAVASRATLWVNGEPREASIAGRGAVRAAYTSIVSTARDPLLVTTDGAQRLLVQAFPINADSTMRLRIGFTAPFKIAPDGQRALALPAIAERNFDLPDSLRHAVWVEGDAPLGGATRTNLADTDLLARRPSLTLPDIRAGWTATGGVAAAGKAPGLGVMQRVEQVSGSPRPLMLVVDASEDTEAAAAALVTALDVIEADVPVGLVIAADKPVAVAPAPWSPEQAVRIREALGAIPFRGGQDGRAALAQALTMVPRGDAALLWVHGVQPVRFARPEPALEQSLERLRSLPQLIRYQPVPGRALTLGDDSWFDTARLPTPTGDAAADLRSILAEVTGRQPRWEVRRVETSAAGSGSAGLVRLWAGDVLAGSARSRGRDRAQAIALAHRLNLVSPVSGAVVLETDKDYGENGLPVPDPDAVPTIPEPETWALLILIALAAAFLFHRQRREAWA